MILWQFHDRHWYPSDEGIYAHGGQFLQSAKPAEQRTLGQPSAQPAIILAEQAAQHIATQGAVTVPLVALAGLGFGGGKLLVVTREALFDKGFFHAAQAQELIHPAQPRLELLVIAIAQDDRQSWTQGRLEGQDACGGRRVFH
jgi:hypothetical protein